MLKNINYEKGLPVKIEIASISNYPIHMHPDIQIIYVLEGCIDLKLTFKTYHLKKNDLRYIHSEDIHSIYSTDKDNKVIIISIDIEYIEKLFPNIRTVVITMPTDKTLLLYNNQQQQLEYYIFTLLNEFLKDNDDINDQVYRILKNIFGIIYREFRGFTIDKENKSFVYKRLQDMKQTERLGEIIDDIYKNYVEPSTLEEIASRQNLNPYYLSHLFSQAIGINYRDFVNMVRVETSEYDLLASELSIAHITMSSGFSNSLYYNRHFEFWFGMSPHEYRNKYANKTIGVIEPDIKYYNLSECKDIIYDNLERLKTAFIDMPNETVSELIHLIPTNFDKVLRFDLELNCYNPDFLNQPDEYFYENEIFTPDFLNKYISHLKIRIDNHEQDKENNTESEEMYSCIKRIFENAVTEHKCNFNVGVTREATIYTSEFIKTPVYYVMKFFAQDYESIYIDTYYIVLKQGNSYQILCWNLNLTHEKKITVKSEDTFTVSFVTVSKINLDDYSQYLSEIRAINAETRLKRKIPQNVERILENKLFAEEYSFFHEGSVKECRGKP